MESICGYIYLKVELQCFTICSCRQPVSLVQHMLGHCKQLNRVGKSGWFVSYRHLAYGYISDCIFKQMALTCKYDFWAFSIYNYEKSHIDVQNF
jgi:hypothetical protein